MDPDLEIVLQKPLNNYLQYLFAGGLIFRQLLPSFILQYFFILFYFILIRSVFVLYPIIARKNELKSNPIVWRIFCITYSSTF